jgi:hypothetical protein
LPVTIIVWPPLDNEMTLMPRPTHRIVVSVVLLAIWHLAAAADPTISDTIRATRSVQSVPSPAVEIPVVNWTVPQFLDVPAGVTSSLATSFVGAAGKVNAKNDLGMSVFRPIAPCRLVDTRGVFSPVYAGGPFASFEVRTYRTQGNCGIPVGTNRVKAVSIAITTLPSGASGDVETVPHGTPLGNTVDMVVQAGEWNSVSKIVRVDANGDFDMQLRFTSGHLAIDINGYFSDVNDANPGDFYSVRGKYAIDGGLFYSENSSSIGAAIRAFNSESGSDVALAQGANALDIAAGQIRVRGAGNNTSTPAFIHQVTAPNLCPDTRYTRLTESHVSGSNASAGQLLFVQEAAHAGADTSVPKLIRTVFASGLCNGAPPSWFLFTSVTFAVGETYDVLVINP